MGTGQSAVIIEVPEAEALVGDWRRRCDPSARRGIPAHVTVLFPFAGPVELADGVLERLRGVIASHPVAEFSLVALDEFPDAIWLRPEPADRLRALTQAVWDAFPDHPPYGGTWTESNPHLTLAQVGDARRQAEVRRELDAALPPHLPIHVRAAAVSVFVHDGEAEDWRLLERLPFGVARGEEDPT